MEKGQSFFNNGAKQVDIHMQKKNKPHLDTELTLFPKINSKWLTDLNVKCKKYKTPRRKHR